MSSSVIISSPILNILILYNKNVRMEVASNNSEINCISSKAHQQEMELPSIKMLQWSPIDISIFS